MNHPGDHGWLLCRGLDMDGKLVNGPVRDYSWSEIVERSSKGGIQSSQSFEKLTHVFTVVVVSGNNDQNPTFSYLEWSYISGSKRLFKSSHARDYLLEFHILTWSYISGNKRLFKSTFFTIWKLTSQEPLHTCTQQALNVMGQFSDILMLPNYSLYLH